MARLPTYGINRPRSLRWTGPAAVGQRRPSAPLEATALHTGSGPVPLSPIPAGPLRSSIDRALPGHFSASLGRLHGRDRPTGARRPHGGGPRPHPRPRPSATE
ncbi:hypothetical protein NDU88_009586 [Pleurodeles waltl]|uniref:Uncharacterized protein n=1 Tax=Pleurodeles waltl TaxID=8319 RepID=A0AAV7QVJ2_PLEWA|nr:hypothetical protein NDU88_009586 [Pleurodeles waltl]